jgi:GTPase SAR1 family protein
MIAPAGPPKVEILWLDQELSADVTISILFIGDGNTGKTTLIQ